MCGLFVLITPGRQVPQEACWQAIEAQEHRGPDGQGVIVGRLGGEPPRFSLNARPDPPDEGSFNDTFMGHRRLSIIDLSDDAFQPMSNESGDVWVVFNGEIYNHAELRDRLVGLGHRFRTDHSDTEVLVHGYEQWGDELVEHLRGMFAFAVVDLERRRALAARDRFGEKPLYYLLAPDMVALSSELKSLLALPGFDRRISPVSMGDYLLHGYIPAPRSVYRGVSKLRAAERLAISLDDIPAARPRTYWSLAEHAVPDPGSPKGWTELFQEELYESIKLRLISDVPLGAFLSGGIDSSVVVQQASRAVPGAVNTFTVGFHEREYDESGYARAVSKRYATNHREWFLRVDDLLDTVPKIAAVFDEPFADSSAVPTYQVSRLAREHVTVCLSGDGGDEMLAGYTRYVLLMRMAQLLDRLPGWAGGLLGIAAGLWPEYVRGKGIVRFALPTARERYQAVFRDEYLVGLTKAGLLPDHGRALSSVWPDEGDELLNRICIADSRFYIPEDLMVKVDRCAMAVSLESRAPLLDHKLFEIAMSMPVSQKFDEKQGKIPLRQILEKDLPQSVRMRGKRGFSMPVGRWFRDRTALLDRFQDLVLAPGSLCQQVFPRKNISGLVHDHLNHSRDQSGRLWRLFMLENWAQSFGGTL